MLEHRPLLESPKTNDVDRLDIAYLAPEINLIPFIDVLLVILIFLMISTTFTQYQELSITLPSVAGESSASSVKEIRVAVSRDGKYALNGNVVETTALAEKISLIKNQAMQNNEANLDSLRVVISADAKASHQSVMQILEIASQAGLNNIVFATQDTQATPKKR
jgi:biopolymer transport protein ExbD